MRRLALITSALLLLTGCSDGSSDETTTTAPSAVTTTVAETTTTVAETTTTVEEATTTTTVEATTTTVAAPDEFETLAGTAPDAFDSYTATMSITMGLEDLEITVSADGTWTGDAFQCTMSSDMAGIAFSESIISTPETLWYDQGNGYEETSLFDTSASDIMGSCPASPTFWADFAIKGLPEIEGDEVTFAGRPAYEADLTDLVGAMSGLGIAGLDADFIQAMTVWIDIETNTVLGLSAQLEMPAEMMGDLTDTGPIPMTMDLALDNINDPGLEIELP